MMKSTMKPMIRLGLGLALVIAPSAVVHARTHFVVMGDIGTGDCNQYKVARALKHWKDNADPANPIAFVLLAGDNFYDRGLRTFCSEEQNALNRKLIDETKFQNAFID